MVFKARGDWEGISGGLLSAVAGDGGYCASMLAPSKPACPLPPMGPHNRCLSNVAA